MASAELTQPLKRLDRGTCAEFVEANYRSLYRWFLWLTNSSSDAADLTQDTFVALWESLDRFREDMPLKPWLYGIARNVWRKRCAQRDEEPMDEESFAEMPDPNPTPEQAMLNKEATRILEEAVAQLPHDYREAVTLRFWEDLDYSEMAQMLSISEELARWRVHQGRKLLRERLLRAGIMEEEFIRAGGKLGWWMRVHERPGPTPELLEQCMATIPQMSDQLPVTSDQLAVTSDQSPRASHSSLVTGHWSLVTDAVRVGTLDDLKAKSCMVVSLDRPVVVFYHDGHVYALDNRCPHMGFPLHRGSVQDGILTCYWHHARFDLASGCTFDLFADDVPTYPVEIRDGEVWVLPRRATDEVSHWKRRLKEGMQQNIPLVVAKAVIVLLHHGVDVRNIVRQGALFGTCYQDNWADGLTILTTMANLLPHLRPPSRDSHGAVETETPNLFGQLPYLSGDERFLPLWHGLVRVSGNVYGQSPRFERQPLTIDNAPLPTLKRWLRRWTAVRHRDGAERCLLTAIANGASPEEVADLLFTAATDRIFADGGHVMDFINKAFEILDLTGWEHASEVLPTLMPRLVHSRGGEESSEWRQSIDLVAMLNEVSGELPTLMEEGKLTGQWVNGSMRQIEDFPTMTELAQMILGDNPADIVNALKDAIRRGAQPTDLSKTLAYAAALRIVHFGTANESSDWVTVLHTFSYCHALHQMLKRMTQHATRNTQYELLRGIFHGALKIYLDRFLNIPPAPLPTYLDDEPTDAQELLTKFIETLDRPGQVNEAGRIVARYLSLHHPVEPLIRTLTYAVVREDAEFHTYQMLEASVSQYEEWKGTEEGNHILIAAARYIAAWSPTRRTMLQTATVALRLHRGEALYEQEEA